MNPDSVRPQQTHASTEAMPLVDLITAATTATEATPQAGRLSGVMVAECLDEHHPQLTGRVLVRIAEANAARELWVATLTHSVVRRGDRILVMQPANWPEPVVVGVLDGVHQRTAPTVTAAAMNLRRDEQIVINDYLGAPLLSIIPSDNGPVLRLARADQQIEIDGRLAIAADAIELRARGGMNLTAAGDVVVAGEEIKLN